MLRRNWYSVWLRILSLPIEIFVEPLIRIDMFVFIVSMLVIIGIIYFIVAASKKKAEGEDLGERS